VLDRQFVEAFAYRGKGRQPDALDGALHEVSTREKWVTDPEAREQWLRERHSQSQLDLATVDGAAQETYFWLQTYDMRSRGVGDRLVREEKKP